MNSRDKNILIYHGKPTGLLVSRVMFGDQQRNLGDKYPENGKRHEALGIDQEKGYIKYLIRTYVRVSTDIENIRGYKMWLRK